MAAPIASLADEDALAGYARRRQLGEPLRRRAEAAAHRASPCVGVALPLAREWMRELEEPTPEREGAALAAVDQEAVVNAVRGRGEVVARDDGEHLAHLIVGRGGDDLADDAHRAADGRLGDDLGEQIVDEPQIRIGEDRDAEKLFLHRGACPDREILAPRRLVERLLRFLAP